MQYEGRACAKDLMLNNKKSIKTLIKKIKIPYKDETSNICFLTQIMIIFNMSCACNYLFFMERWQ